MSTSGSHVPLHESFISKQVCPKRFPRPSVVVSSLYESSKCFENFYFAKFDLTLFTPHLQTPFKENQYVSYIGELDTALLEIPGGEEDIPS